jgi:hypothetical protein
MLLGFGDASGANKRPPPIVFNNTDDHRQLP